VYIWVESLNRTGSVISRVSSNITTVQFAGEVNKVSLKFNQKNSTFSADNARASGGKISYSRKPGALLELIRE
jgi:hypothetical protein